MKSPFQISQIPKMQKESKFQTGFHRFFDNQSVHTIDSRFENWKYLVAAID